MFAYNGRPGEEPVRLTAVLLLQFMERLPDRHRDLGSLLHI